MSVSFQTAFQPETSDRPAVFSLVGSVSYREAGRMRTALFNAIDQGNLHLLVDLAEVETMDTAALAVLVEGLVATEDTEKEMFLCTPSASVRRIFHLAGLEGALAKCWGCMDSASESIAG